MMAQPWFASSSSLTPLSLMTPTQPPAPFTKDFFSA
jgi:hypothetical protein